MRFDDGEFIDVHPDVLRQALQDRIHEAPPISCEKCNTRAELKVNEVAAGFNVTAICPLCGHSEILMECYRVIIPDDPTKGLVQ